MCGIIITKSPQTEIIDSIKHRGIEKSLVSKNDVVLCHHRLPIQTVDGDDWNQPIELTMEFICCLMERYSTMIARGTILMWNI